MAKQKNNVVMRNTRGMFAKQVVFKKRNGVSYVSGPPDVKENRQPTERQGRNRERFQAAVRYAKAVIAIPIQKEMYDRAANRRQSAYNVAFSDAFNAPQILDILIDGYTGQPGNLILINAIDDFRVSSVHIAIRTEDGDLIEEGNAIERGNGSLWTYTASRSVADLSGLAILVTVQDLPGNRVTSEINL